MCGASNAESSADYHYVTLQQSAEDADEPDDEERDIHFEIDDQINSGYDLVRECRLTRDEWRLSVSGEFEWYPNLQEIVIDLTAIDDDAWHALRTGLQRTFREHADRLHVEA